MLLLLLSQEEIYYHSFVKWHFLLLFLKTSTSAFVLELHYYENYVDVIRGVLHSFQNIFYNTQFNSMRDIQFVIITALLLSKGMFVLQFILYFAVTLLYLCVIYSSL